MSVTNEIIAHIKKTSSGLYVVFLLGTENGDGQIDEPPCISDYPYPMDIIHGSYAFSKLIVQDFTFVLSWKDAISE